MEEFKLYWEDLTKATQKRLYKFLGNENGNFDVIPFHIFEKESKA